MTEDIRKIVTTRVIDDLRPIEGADRIELAVVGGWHVVVRKGEFEPGEEVFYFEIDSFLPASVEPFAFLSEKSAKTAISPEGQDVRGHVLRTMRLRGQLSQGLILKKSAVAEEDIAQVFKWEAPLPTGYGAAIGSFPYFIQKTDAERVQNLSVEFLEREVFGKDNHWRWSATEKIDGTSSTWYMDPEKGLRAFGRNWELSLEESGMFRSIAEKYNIAEKLIAGQWVQGEIYGPGVQKNPLNMPELSLAIFNWDGIFPDLPYVPMPRLDVADSIEGILAQVDGLISLVNPSRQAEGIVWWDISSVKHPELGYRECFKTINNNYLAHQKD